MPHQCFTRFKTQTTLTHSFGLESLLAHGALMRVRKEIVKPLQQTSARKYRLL